MSICILTYDAPHLKTAQVFNILQNRGIENVDFMIMPFVQRTKREVLFAHRPEQFEGVGARELAAKRGRSVHPYSDWENLLDRYEQFIVCGSNLIDRDFANSGRILNCHSGLIPSVRGLDSFKWAILNKKPIGNTLHQLDEFADAGVVLAHFRTPVYSEDSLSTFAARHYDNEIWMLGYYDWVIQNGRIEEFNLGEPTKRMPIAVEQEMIDAFEAYKSTFA